MTHGPASTVFVGVVPCAGASVRMGRTKALLKLGDATFLERVVHTLRDGGCNPVFVVVDEEAGAVATEARFVGAEVLVNPRPGDGPITSLRIAIAAVDPLVDGIAYLPVDYALIRPDTVSTLLEAAHSSGAALTLPVHGIKRGHPAIFRRSLFEELLDPELEEGARTIVHRHLTSARIVVTSDPSVIADIDTPEAYEEALRAYEVESVGYARTIHQRED